MKGRVSSTEAASDNEFAQVLTPTNNALTTPAPSSPDRKGIAKWYLGSYSSTGKHYCGNRLGKCGFITLHVLLGIVLILSIWLPTIVNVTIPHGIRHKFDEVVRDPAVSSSKSTNSTSDQTIVQVTSPTGFTVTTSINKATWVPGTVELVGPTVFTISDIHGKKWANVVVDNLSFPANKRSTQTIQCNLHVFDTPSPDVINDIFARKQFALVIHTVWHIKFWGFTWYKHLELDSQYDMTIDHTLEESFDEIVRNPDANELKKLQMELLAGINNFRVTVPITAPATLPGTIEVTGPTVVSLTGATSGLPWANITFGSLSLPIYEDTNLVATGNLNLIGNTRLTDVVNILKTRNMVMNVNTWVTIKLWGYVWYTNLPLSSQFDANSVTGKEIWPIIESILKNSIR
ncbi:unnamed protein product [Aphanomyces euteiches]|uniref:Uncharacterized protein n=1 Tax=Aphanomyces euteiches TaxID=100861 RepID=A0A6G0X956_9STRA|nr:hypothetical protein Ae201684_007074 [Aphanomyces euteiches]KAH9052525.1 hypothetical protein Ae201684P_001705 [Aphanomyces euteiches]KAH9157365.1 hypothetical protein AeRB84_000783 [Aphanomyces euteiches]